MLAPGLPDIAAKYGVTSTTETSLMLSVFLISFAIGVRRLFAASRLHRGNSFFQPLILAPLSEMYGRTWVCQPIIAIFNH